MLNFRLAFIFRHPKIVDAINVFILPFDKTVWFLIVVIGIIISIFHKLLSQLENRSQILTENEGSYSNSLLMVFGILFQQGTVQGMNERIY